MRKWILRTSVMLLGAAMVAATFSIDGSSAAPVAKQNSGKSSLKTSLDKRKQFKAIASPWKLNCQPGRGKRKVSCVLTSNLILGKRRLVFASISLRANLADRKNPYILFMRLPHGLSFPSGVLVKIDEGKAEKVPFLTSSRAGAIARMKVGSKLAEKLRKGGAKTLKLSFRSLKDGREFAAVFPLKGLAVLLPKLD